MATFIKYESDLTGKVTWQAKIRRKGQEEDQTKTFRRKIDAEKWAASVEGDMARGRFVDRGKAEDFTLKEALEKYEAEVSILKKGHKQEKSRIALWKDSEFASLGLAFIKSQAVAEWRDARLKDGAAANTVKNDLLLISHLFTVASREWDMPELINPVSKIRKPNRPKAGKCAYPATRKPFFSKLCTKRATIGLNASSSSPLKPPCVSRKSCPLADH